MIENLFPLILMLHIGTLFVIGGLMLATDFSVLKWIQGSLPMLPHQKTLRLHRFIWGGLITLLITGILLFYPYKDFLVTLTAFRIKIAFVGLLILNSFYIGKVLPLGTTQTFISLSPSQKTNLFISGSMSVVCWIGATITGMMLGL